MGVTLIQATQLVEDAAGGANLTTVKADVETIIDIGIGLANLAGVKISISALVAAATLAAGLAPGDQALVQVEFDALIGAFDLNAAVLVPITTQTDAGLLAYDINAAITAPVSSEFVTIATPIWESEGIEAEINELAVDAGFAVLQRNSIQTELNSMQLDSAFSTEAYYAPKIYLNSVDSIIVRINKGIKYATVFFSKTGGFYMKLSSYQYFPGDVPTIPDSDSGIIVYDYTALIIFLT